jgi:hypothetical protein
MASPYHAHVAASLDDGMNTSSVSQFANGSVIWGQPYAWSYYRAFFRFVNVTIPQGSTITAAYLTFVADANYNNTHNTTIYGEQNNNAATLSTFADLNARTLTSTSVVWSEGAWTAQQSYDSDDISTIIQELLDDYSGLTNANIAIILHAAGAGYGNQHGCKSYDLSSTLCAALTITWTEPVLYIPIGVNYKQILAH